MTHFYLLDGATVGSTFAGDAGRTYHVSHDEFVAVLNASLDEPVYGSDGSAVKMLTFLVTVFSLPRASEEELTRRGFDPEGSLEPKLAVSEDGRLLYVK